MADKIPLTSEKKVVFDGIFEIKKVYSFLKDFLETSRHYDLTEKEYEESALGGKRKIVTLMEAEQEYNDYYKIIIKYKLILEGKETVIKDHNGQDHKVVDGKATFFINSYLEPDFLGKRPKGGIGLFLDKIYENFIGTNDVQKVGGVAVGDVGELINRFKQYMNSHTR